MNRTYIRAELIPVYQSLARLLRDRAARGAPFWQQDWKKHRRRGWKRHRAAGRHDAIR